MAPRLRQRNSCSAAATVSVAADTDAPASVATKSTSRSRTPGLQGRGRRLTDRERMEIIALTRENPRLTHVALAARYGVNETTIRKWRRAANAAKIETRYSAGVAQVRDSCQRACAVRNAAFDAALHAWASAQLVELSTLSAPAIRAKARELAVAYDDMRDFKASSGWYYRFCRRYGLPVPSRTGRRRSLGVTKVNTVVDDSAATEGVVESDTAEEADENDSDSGENNGSGEGNGNSEGNASGEEDCSGAERHLSDHRDGNADEPATDGDAAETLVVREEQLPPITCALLNVVEPTSPPASKKRKLVDATSEEGDTTQQPPALESPPLSESSPSPETPAPLATAVATTTTAPVASVATTTPDAPATTVASVLSTRQEAIAHFLQHHKALVSLSCRLRFIKHLAHATEDAEMYVVMDDETRVEYIREFAEADRVAHSDESGRATGGVTDAA